MSQRIVLLSGLVCLLVFQLFGQEAGQIVGAVHDQTGAVVPGAKVTATEAGTGLARTATTSSEGAFVLPSLRPTSYIISTEAAGFRAVRQTGVQLLANQSLTINISLEVG